MGKGSSGGDTYDAAYNARMATIAEGQHEMAQTYFDFWESDYRPMEEEQIAANREMIPIETELNKSAMQSQLELLPEKTATAKAFYQEAREGVDVESRVDRAAADAAQAFMDSDSILRRSSARSGINPNSGNYSAMKTKTALEQAKVTAGVKTAAREGAEQENFNRLASAMSTGG